MSQGVVVSLRDQLQAIYDEYGRLDPVLVVAVARPPDHPLHPRVFDKPVADAAEAYYRERAHELIQSVRVVYKEATETEPEKTVRAFQAVRSAENEYVYKPVGEVVENPFTRQLVLMDMERRWKALHRQYADFSEFAEMVRGDLNDG